MTPGSRDVHADGVADLVIAAAQRGSEGLACRGAAIWVFADGRLDAVTEIGVPDGRLAAGVLGSFDDVPGDDLAVYAAPECRIQTEEPPVFSLRVVRLADGTVVVDRPAAATGLVPTTVGPPVRFDADGDGNDELLALVPFGLAVIDPRSDGPVIRVGSTGAFPLGAAPVVAPDGAVRNLTRVAWMEPSFERRGAVGAVVVERGPDGALHAAGPPTWLWTTVPTATRWILAVTAAETAGEGQAPPVGWLSDDPSGCPDLYVPTAVLSCSTGDVLAGPAWIGTRPVLGFDGPDGRRILVAAALDDGQDLGLPATPIPWAGFEEGAWRHGPSVPIALAEVAGDDLATDATPDLPAMTPTAASGPSATLRGTAGTRLFVRAEALAPDAPEPAASPDLVATLSSAVSRYGRASIQRTPVPPGAASGSERSTTSIPLGDVRSASGEVAQRWAVTAVALSDTGELAAPVASSVRLDIDAPDLEVVSAVRGGSVAVHGDAVRHHRARCERQRPRRQPDPGRPRRGLLLPDGLGTLAADGRGDGDRRGGQSHGGRDLRRRRSRLPRLPVAGHPRGRGPDRRHRQRCPRDPASSRAGRPLGHHDTAGMTGRARSSRTCRRDAGCRSRSCRPRRY